MLIVAVLAPVPAEASATDPSQWPRSTTLDPDLTSTPNTVRFSGSDRYQTNLAISFGLRGAGDYPFDTADRTSGNASTLAAARDWWGIETCPRSVIVVAGDTVADALAAASLSDPTDRSNQPRMQRVAAVDPTFDVIGGFDRVDTAFAPIIVTRATRDGAVGLAPSARLSVTDLAAGGCRSAREALVVGGYAAVPAAVEAELVGLGYAEVFRVAGVDRFETAARVAAALGTGRGTDATSCTDADTTDGFSAIGYYGNAVAEYRSSPTSCLLLPRSVVLADGDVGADALPAGWWTSQWQVPVLLTAGGALPTPTADALRSLRVETIIVLGGTNRIPESTVNEAATLASAHRVGRIAGVDRYSTSVEMAEAFGGWRRTGRGSDATASRLCFAASGGSGPQGAGWPDALAAGPWCARLGASAQPGPVRALPPVTGLAIDATTGLRPPSRPSAPILLVPPAGPLPESVARFLSASFPSEERWCSGDAVEDCLDPGFGVVFGGPDVISEATSQRLSEILGGGVPGARQSPAAFAEGGFATALDLGPVFAGGMSTGPVRWCVLRGGVAGARWLAVYSDAARERFVGEVDVAAAGRYAAGRSVPMCIDVPAAASTVWPTTATGEVGAPRSVDAFPERRTSLSQPIHLLSADGVSFTGAPAGVTIQSGSRHVPVVWADLTLQLDRTSSVFGAVGTLASANGRYLLELRGERSRSEADVGQLRGRAVLVSPDGTVQTGGVFGDLSGATGAERLSVMFDAYPPVP